MNKSTRNQVYFYLILTASIIWLIILPKPFRNYAPIIFIIPTFPFFMFNYYSKLIEFSNMLKTMRPDLFNKYVVDYGNAFKGEIVNIGLANKNNDFENLENIELREKYLLSKQSIKLGIISFLIFPVLGIVTICL
ncbi:hypothetical protein [Flavobacterium terrigena]|uniref:Uncharacterized protein n=1 Tax=Flavobacterium terrigena TaxID=402734 RepID=A0A1H6VZL2_9FLAO|nr:hypothetical protein [Flavobacterium terrigena]SEJ10063.1 hypothetical protein SAMN05660918_2367 [Flavobacterium terrigena]